MNRFKDQLQRIRKRLNTKIHRVSPVGLWLGVAVMLVLVAPASMRCDAGSLPETLGYIRPCSGQNEAFVEQPSTRTARFQLKAVSQT
jgi:hypothetical protein